MFSWEYLLGLFQDTLIGHAAMAVFLFAVMDEHGWQRLKKLPALLFSPLAAVFVSLFLLSAFPHAPRVRLFIASHTNLLACTLWVRWAWRIRFCPAFTATCMAGVFQLAATNLSHILFTIIPLDDMPRSAVVMAVFWAVVLPSAFLLYRLRFGVWFRLLLENRAGQGRMALLLFALETAMMSFFFLQKGIRPEYLVPYYLLVVTVAVLIAGLVVYLAHQLDAVRKLDVQRDIIAQQQLYERNLEEIRREVRAFRHDYKNLLAGLSEQADEGELEQLRATLSELDAGFDRRIGEKIRASTQIGSLRIPQVRSLLLSKLALMGEKGIDCRLEVLYPVERIAMDLWDFTRCLGILLDNAAEAALETGRPWVEIVLLAQEEGLSLRVSNPYAGAIAPDKIWAEGFSTKGAGRGLGLPSYQRILAGYPDAAFATSWAEGIFVQKLTIGGTL